MTRLPSEVEGACKVLGISRNQVMDYHVYEDQVVLIEGPVGYKRFVPFERIAEFEAEEGARTRAVEREAEVKAKAEREVQDEAKRKARAEKKAEAKAKREAEAKAKKEAKAKAKAEKEAKAEAERVAKAEKKAKEEARGKRRGKR